MIAVATGVQIPAQRLGLSASGTNFVKGGANWRGIGVSHFDLMISAIQGGLGTDTDYMVDIPAIAARGIPFIRFSAGFYNQSSWYAGWHNDKATYLAKMDEVVALAEANHIGYLRCCCGVPEDLQIVCTACTAFSSRLRCWLTHQANRGHCLWNL